MASKLCLVGLSAVVLVTFGCILYRSRSLHVGVTQPKPSRYFEASLIDEDQSLTEQPSTSPEAEAHAISRPHNGVSHTEPPSSSTQVTLRPRTKETKELVQSPTQILSQGYILSLHFSDQMTGAMANVLSLQCWAEQSNLLVVEPFVIHSWLGASLKTGREGSEENAVRLSDVFDIDVWQRHSREKGYSRLVSWEEFLSNAPRDVIIASQPVAGDCKHKMDKLRSISMPFATEHNFTVVKEVCFNFGESGVLTDKGILSHLYGEYLPQQVTVLFRRWGGIGKTLSDIFRMRISDSRCGRNVSDVLSVSTKSQSLMDDVQQYISTYLNGASTFTAVMVRFQYFIINHKLLTDEQLKYHPTDSHQNYSALLESCLQSILTELRSLKADNSTTLLTMDFGTHGSQFSNSKGEAVSIFKDYPWMDKQVKSLFRSIYGSSLSLEEWEDSFEFVAKKNNSGYIAQMQKELAARAQCLMLAGADGQSSFQEQTKSLFESYHGKYVDSCFARACN